VVSTIAGTPGTSGSSDGTGAAAKFNEPKGIVLSGGFLFVADGGNGKIRKVDPTSGSVTTVGDG